MEKREAINVLLHHKEAFEISGKTAEAIDLVISALDALEKQEVDKCCETCKYEHLELDAYPCCDCIRAKDHYEHYTEGES